uniref:Uncharacterized protein n=1 Tax=Nelumbo nucifera TaxID=4432 RepID=A0A822YTE3_NELNU|nr:TPA_asm: hypothetical protein HUJ06_011349 [Nelumbo nucifera]
MMSTCNRRTGEGDLPGMDLALRRDKDRAVRAIATVDGSAHPANKTELL